MADDELIGQNLGAFTVLSLLGRGGMANVYRAEQRSLKRPVALKVIRRLPGEGQDLVTRFQREKEVMQKLEHPHILPIFDYAGNSECLWIAMRLVEGGTLDNWLDQGPVELPRLARAVTQLAAALDFAHQQGVVHRDLKPSNVLVDQGDHLYLTDFGVAKLIEQEGLTLPGTALGTPGYMAPEQIQGGGVGGSIDQYALAIMAYQMATGTVPFIGQLVDVLHQHINAAPVPPRQLRPELPVEAERAILKALSKDPQDRFATNSDFAAALSSSILPLGGDSQRFPAPPKIPVPGKKGLGLLALPMLAAAAWFLWPAPSSRSFPLVFEARSKGANEIQLRQPDGKISKLGNGTSPTFWPGGKFVSVDQAGKVVRISVPDGQVNPLVSKGQGATVSPDEKLLVFGRGDSKNAQLFQQPLAKGIAHGEAAQLTRSESHHQGATFSPDGTKVACFVDEADHYSIWTVELATGRRQSITSPAVGENDSWPAWSPDGSQLVFQRKGSSGALELRVVRADGQGKDRAIPLPKDCGPPQTPSWSPSTDIAFRTDKGIFCVGPEGQRFRLLVQSPDAKTRLYTPCWGPML